MNIEVTAKNTDLIERIGLHDVLLESMMWKFDGDSVTFKMSNWEWNNEGKLTLQGVVYCEASALGYSTATQAVLPTSTMYMWMISFLLLIYFADS